MPALGSPLAMTSYGPPTPVRESRRVTPVTPTLSDDVHEIDVVVPTTITSPEVLGPIRCAVGRVASTNVAVIDLSSSITTVSGFALPLASPLQPENAQPGLGVAV